MDELAIATPYVVCACGQYPNGSGNMHWKVGVLLIFEKIISEVHRRMRTTTTMSLICSVVYTYMSEGTKDLFGCCPGPGSYAQAAILAPGSQNRWPE